MRKICACDGGAKLESRRGWMRKNPAITFPILGIDSRYWHYSPFDVGLRLLRYTLQVPGSAETARAPNQAAWSTSRRTSFRRKRGRASGEGDPTHSARDAALLLSIHRRFSYSSCLITEPREIGAIRLFTARETPQKSRLWLVSARLLKTRFPKAFISIARGNRKRRGLLRTRETLQILIS